MEDMIALALAITVFAIVIYFAVRADSRLNKNHPGSSQDVGFTFFDGFGGDTESVHSADDKEFASHQPSGCDLDLDLFCNHK